MKNFSGMIERCNQLADSAKVLLVGSIDESNFPNIKAMFKCENNGISEFFFSTNTSSNRVQQFLKNNKACVYLFDKERIDGVMLKGKMTLIYDNEIRGKYWSDGDEKYYTLGVEDPDYVILKFTAETGRYYGALSSCDFEVKK